MGKINLAKQNQYVEFAQKDDEGNSISQAFKTIEEAIEGKVVFDGSVTVETIGGDKGIKKANLPTTAGVYKLSSGGVLCVGVNTVSSITLTAIYKDNMYTETRDPASTADFKFIEDNRMGDKPIYLHPIYCYKNVPNTYGLNACCMIFNNSASEFTTSTFLSYCHSLMDNGARIMITGRYLDVANNKNYSLFVADKSESNYNMYGYDPDGQILSFPFDNLAVYQDGVNRIN